MKIDLIGSTEKSRYCYYFFFPLILALSFDIRGAFTNRVSCMKVDFIYAYMSLHLWFYIWPFL